MASALLDRIAVDPAVCGGKPTVRGHRVPVSLILGCLVEGWSVDRVADEFPGIVADDVRACIAYAALLVDVRLVDLDVRE